MKYFRKDTWDRAIADSVIRHKEYGNIDFAGKVVVDIGCHIGSFSFLAAKSGAKKVVAFEAFKDNYELAVKNLSDYSAIATVIPQAMWRSDVPETKLCFAKCHEPVNTGGGTVFGTLDDIEHGVSTVALDDVLRLLGHVDVMKLDCEGSEFPILLTSKELARVDLIVGEYHEMGYNIPDIAQVDGYGEYMQETLGDFLCGQGFSVSLTKSADHLGKFVAKRPCHEHETPRES